MDSKHSSHTHKDETRIHATAERSAPSHDSQEPSRSDVQNKWAAAAASICGAEPNELVAFAARGARPVDADVSRDTHASVRTRADAAGGTSRVASIRGPVAVREGDPDHRMRGRDCEEGARACLSLPSETSAGVCLVHTVRSTGPAWLGVGYTGPGMAGITHNTVTLQSRAGAKLGGGFRFSSCA
jgi:hypothetical protein